MERLSDVPLFPLGIVLLPGETLPLHIFEPRYRDLVARCEGSGEAFCIAFADGTALARTACLAGDLQVLERLPDGRLNIAVTGTSVVRIDDVDGERHSYLACDASVLADEEDVADPVVVSAALQGWRELAEAARPSQDPPSDPEPGPRLSYAIARRVDLDAADKQALLDDRSESSRLTRVTELLARAVAALRVGRAVAERAHRNGHVRFTEGPDAIGGEP